jgi:thiosulfate dehydrogenase [quinone] large subunit
VHHHRQRSLTARPLGESDVVTVAVRQQHGSDVGLAWLQSGLGKLADPGWAQGGASLRAYWERAATIPEAPARPPITYEWYRDFLNMLMNANAESWFSWVLMLGEVAVGLGLIFGALTGLAAFFGAFMNMSFLLAGSASTNPVLFTLSIGLILAWKVAGYYGLDRWLLPRLGAPWRPGAIVGARSAESRITVTGRPAGPPASATGHQRACGSHVLHGWCGPPHG